MPAAPAFWPNAAALPFVEAQCADHSHARYRPHRHVNGILLTAAG
ncbi:MAG: hypothetical protein Q4G70_15495 [Pseudomonadota bacterium]|nr:hypothetical protein [Pseudomonadota bacterium]